MTNKTSTPIEHKRFIKDMREAGFKVRRHTAAQFKGPAVDVGAVEDAVSKTKVKCQWEASKEGFLVYPVSSGEYSW